MKGGLTAQLDLIEELGLGFENCPCDGIVSLCRTATSSPLL